MENIVVTIPTQEYSRNKYIGNIVRCYLEEALDKAGFKYVSVSGGGSTKIGITWYTPSEPFNATIVKEAFDKNESITVTLIPD